MAAVNRSEMAEGNRTLVPASYWKGPDFDATGWLSESELLAFSVSPGKY
jgi:hypothetical protein